MISRDFGVGIILVIIITVIIIIIITNKITKLGNIIIFSIRETVKRKVVIEGSKGRFVTAGGVGFVKGGILILKIFLINN